MQKYKNKRQDDQSPAVIQNVHNTALPLEDNRTSVQRKNMPSMKEEEDIVQKKQFPSGKEDEDIVQKKQMSPGKEEEDIVQKRQLTPGMEEEETVQKKENNTGLPDQLKSGIENLSGHSMDDVKVHYNSPQPAQLQAHAYAQGTDIHVAPGQEKHLPHEAWHVVQQKQNRVRPTMQLRGKVNVNDNAQLEKEADTMGAKAVQRQRSFVPQVSTFVPAGSLVQQKAVTQLARTKAKTPARTKRTVSGHGDLRVNLKKKPMNFKVPKGKTVMRPAPPGATLGDLSMLMNTMQDPTRDKLVKKMMISTTPEIWGNMDVITLIRASKKIKKTDKQEKILKKLKKGTGFDSLTGGEKGSLASLEKKKEFEEELTDYIEPHTFQTFNENEEMEDMVLTKFEKKLRSSKKNVQNEYVENKTFLSDYVSSNAEDDFVVNACSYDPNSPFTGFQLDQKKKK